MDSSSGSSSVRGPAAERFRTRMAQRPANTSPSRALGDYAGTFRSEMYGDLTVTLENGVLMVRYPRAVEFKLWHFAYDTFLGTSATETAPGPDAAAVRFSLDPMGVVTKVDVQEIGEFTRVRAAR